MLVRTDDEIYRVDSVWLGPPRATFPWRARYVSYGLGLLVMIFVMFVQRRIGIGLDFFSVAWALVLTVVVTRFVGQRINYERPLGQVFGLLRHEVTGPRRRTAGTGGIVRSSHVRTGPVVKPRTPRKSRRDSRGQGTPAGVVPRDRRMSIEERAAEQRKSWTALGTTATGPLERGAGTPGAQQSGRRVQPGSRKGRSRATW